VARNPIRWSDATRAAGLGNGFHLHDLRHTGNTPGRWGPTTKEGVQIRRQRVCIQASATVRIAYGRALAPGPPPGHRVAYGSIGIIERRANASVCFRGLACLTV
jgi:hypothetical protein